jgi:hypothetical protein
MELKLRFKILLVAAAAFVFMGLSIAVTGQPGFCNSCHIMNTYYDSWETSSHSEVNCLDCHLQPGFAGYIKGKINGLAQAVDCMVGRVGTKPNANVDDASCLRSECHSTGEIASTEIDFEGIKFTHENHIDMTVNGISIKCGTCHSHFEGDEHFNVNTDVCVTCHFAKGSDESSESVQTACLDCHEIPKEVIKRGFVTIDHSEFATYQTSCDESCHKRQVSKQKSVSDSVCLNCHSFKNEHEQSSEELHEAHAHKEKVECFACHGSVSHGATVSSMSVSSMMDCTSCHSDTHSAQLGVYMAEGHPTGQKGARVLSPMFLTHVECTGCHIEQGEIRSGSIGSIGTVAKATAAACDKCHKEGTGDIYIPSWQSQIKKLYAQVSKDLDQIKGSGQVTSDEQLQNSIEQAEAILDAVESDGSWGVHNLKYTESMLVKARQIIREAQ